MATRIVSTDDLEFLGLPATAELDDAYEAWCRCSKRFRNTGLAIDLKHSRFTDQYQRLITIGQKLRRAMLDAAS
jgi:hypothetical protein